MSKVLLFDQEGHFSMQTIQVDESEIIYRVNFANGAKTYFDLEGNYHASKQDDLIIITPGTKSNHPVLPIPPREIQVLQLLAAGKTAGQIALELGLSTRTVRGYIANLKMRLGAETSLHLLARAVALGLIDPFTQE